MTESRTIAWIFYSLELASGKEPADFSAISQIADGINHAVPTQKELQESLSWLTRAGLVEKVNRKFCITQQGASLLSSAHAGVTTSSQAWSCITKKIEALQ